MSNIINFSQFVINERLGVPENILNEGENLFNFIIEKLTPLQNQKLSDKSFEYNDEIVISDLKVGKCKVLIQNFETKQDKTLLKGMYFGSDYAIKDFKLIYRGENLTIGIEFYGGKERNFSDVIDILLNDKDSMVSSFSHELKHLYDRYKLGKICVDLSSSYDTFKTIKFGPLGFINSLLYLLYYFDKTENLVRSTEIASLISSKKVTKKEFLNFLKETDFYKMCKRALDVSLEDFKNEIWKEKNLVIKGFESSGIKDYPSDKEKFIQFTMELFQITIENRKSDILVSILNKMIKSQNPLKLLFTNYQSDVSNWMEKRLIKFSKRNPEEFFSNLIKGLKLESETILKKVSKLYDLCLDNDKSINESLPRKRSVQQLKKLRQLTKGIDIGDRTPNLKKQGANIHFMRNPIDDDFIESYEDFEKKNKGFIPGWNAKGIVGPFGK